MSSPPTAPTLGYILKGYPRISETFISNEIFLLEQLGFKMRLFPMRHPREDFCHDAVKQIKAQVNYLPTDLLLELPKLLLPSLFLASKRPGAFKHCLKLARRRYRRTATLATLKHLLQAGYLCNQFLLHDTSLSHLHGHFAHSPTSVTMFAALLSGRTFSFTAHAKDIYTSHPKQLREKIQLAEFVITCTEYNRRYLEKIAKGLDTPIHGIYHGIDLKLFSPQRDHSECTPPYSLLTVARMTEKKGLPTLYRALRLLKDNHFPFQHTLIGDGDDRDKILQLIKDLGLEDCCHCLGTQTHQEVLKQFEASDLFILACEIAENGDRDGIPNVLVESLAMGVPGLSTTVSAVPEILIQNTTGRTVRPSDPETMAHNIKELLEDKLLRKTIIQGGRDHTQKNFDNRRLVASMGNIFKKHLSGTSPIPS